MKRVNQRLKPFLAITLCWKAKPSNSARSTIRLAEKSPTRGHLLTDHPLWGLVDVYAATIPSYRHEPRLHVNYQETVLRIKDRLPKMKDLPKEMGGSGETVAE